MTILPAMPPEQTASWHGILDLYEHLDSGWTLIGGQLVHLHCAARGQFPVRPTNDIDAVIDVRADPQILHTFTKALTDLGFVSAGITGEGRQHRWRREQASIDVLLPEGAGERASRRPGVTGSPTLPTEGGTQALRRSATLPVVVDGRAGFTRRRTWLARWWSRLRRTATPATLIRVATDATSWCGPACSPRWTSLLRR